MIHQRYFEVLAAFALTFVFGFSHAGFANSDLKPVLGDYVNSKAISSGLSLSLIFLAPHCPEEFNSDKIKAMQATKSRYDSRVDKIRSDLLDKFTVNEKSLAELERTTVIWAQYQMLEGVKNCVLPPIVRKPTADEVRDAQGEKDQALRKVIETSAE